MKYGTEFVVKIKESFSGMLGDAFFSGLRKRKSYSPDHCTFQFELGIPCTTISGP